MRGSITVYHHSGVPVALAFDSDNPVDAVERLVEWASDVGFFVNPPGAKKGEVVERIGWLCRSDSERAGRVTPTVLFFPAAEHKTHSILRKYLNDDEEVREFEQGTGVPLRTLPNYMGDNKPERGKSPKTDRFIVKVKPFAIVWTANPDYDEVKAEAAKTSGTPYKTPKRVLARYLGPGGDRRTEATPGPSNGQGGPDTLEDVNWWRRYLITDPPLDAISEKIIEASKIKGAFAKISPAIEEWKTKTGCEWSHREGRFVPPQPAADY